MSAGIETALKRFGEVLSTAGRQHAAALLVLAAVVAAAYSNSVLADLRSDEEALIAASIEGIPGTDLQGLGALIVGIESRLFGFASAPYRVLSMAWHLAAAFGVYLVARRLARDGAYGWFAATLAAAAFAAHPASTHAVNALTDRGVLVGSALALLGAQTMLAAASVPVGNPRRWGSAAISSAALSAEWGSNPGRARA